MNLLSRVSHQFLVLGRHLGDTLHRKHALVIKLISLLHRRFPYLNSDLSLIRSAQILYTPIAVLNFIFAVVRTLYLNLSYLLIFILILDLI